MFLLNPDSIKKKNEKIILKYGGEICNWLGVIEMNKEIRSLNEIIERSLILNAMLNIYFKAPISIINNWIINNELFDKTTSSEREILKKTNAELTERQNISLFWNIEALWALMWAGSLIKEIPFHKSVEDYMASLCPNLEKNENSDKFRLKMKSRNKNEIFEKLDLYYRLHWYTEECRIHNKTPKGISGDVIMERRKALEWICNNNSWDEIELNT